MNVRRVFGREANQKYSIPNSISYLNLELGISNSERAKFRLQWTTIGALMTHDRFSTNDS